MSDISRKAGNVVCNLRNMCSVSVFLSPVSPVEEASLTPLLGKQLSLLELGEQFDHVGQDQRVRGMVFHTANFKLCVGS